MNLSRVAQVTYFLLRVVAGLMFLQHGCVKFLGWFGGIDGQGATAPLLSQAGIGGLLEFFGGILIVLGLLTRPVAFILSGEMAVAYWQFHAAGFWQSHALKDLLPMVNKGELAALYCFVFLFMAAQGGGPWSLDALIWRKRAASTT